MIKRVHVNMHAIRRNKKRADGLLDGDIEPVITVKHGRKNSYGFEVDMPEGCKVVYRPDKPLSCGAKLWVQTEGRVIVDGVDVCSKFVQLSSGARGDRP